MAFSPDLDDAVSRVRFGVGDIAATELFGDAIYEALLLAASNNEVAATRSAAAALAARYANEPTSISSDGSSLSWGERIAQWNKIALGQVGTTAPAATTAEAAASSDGADHEAVW
jgi:ABC-type iron transport system FetAB ATPase subunit